MKRVSMTKANRAMVAALASKLVTRALKNQRGFKSEIHIPLHEAQLILDLALYGLAFIDTADE